MKKTFRSRIDLCNFLKQYDTFDFKKSLWLPFMWFITTDGTVYKNPTGGLFAKTCNKVFGTNFNEELSNSRGNYLVLVFNDESITFVKDNNMKDGDVSKESSVKGVIQEEEEEEEVCVDVKNPPFVDWEWINSLKSNAEGKLTLDNYAAKFDIQLKRNKSLTNMIADFKEALGIEESL